MKVVHKLWARHTATVLAVVAAGSAMGQTKPLPSQTPPTLATKLERFTGPTMVVPLGHNVVLNKESTLKREFFVITDPSSPAYIQGEAGVSVIYQQDSRGAGGEYRYVSNYTVKGSEPIAALEVRAHVFDVFGGLIRTLSSTQVEDIATDKFKVSTWRLLSENEASEAYSSVIYVSRVRTAAGRVYTIDPTSVAKQLTTINIKLTESEIEPKRATK